MVTAKSAPQLRLSDTPSPATPAVSSVARPARRSAASADFGPSWPRKCVATSAGALRQSGRSE